MGMLGLGGGGVEGGDGVGNMLLLLRGGGGGGGVVGKPGKRCCVLVGRCVLVRRVARAAGEEREWAGVLQEAGVVCVVAGVRWGEGLRGAVVWVGV